MESKTTPNDPAYPTIESIYHGSGAIDTRTAAEGLTKREYFSGQAMKALIPVYERQHAGDSKLTRGQYVALLATDYADAMIAELNKPVTP